MFRLSKASEYAIRGLQYLAMQSGDRVYSHEEIAKVQDISPTYLAKLLQELTRKGFVKSYRGLRGGFSLAKPPRDITLLDIIEAIEGPIYLSECLVRNGFYQSEGACHFHQVWQDVQRMFLDCLNGCTLEDIAKTIGSAKSVQN